MTRTNCPCQEIQMPGEKGMTVVFSRKCQTYDSCASLRVKSGGIPKSAMGPGLRVEACGVSNLFWGFP
eukprot:s10283_g1.t1